MHIRIYTHWRKPQDKEIPYLENQDSSLYLSEVALLSVKGSSHGGALKQDTADAHGGRAIINGRRIGPPVLASGHLGVRLVPCPEKFTSMYTNRLALEPLNRKNCKQLA